MKLAPFGYEVKQDSEGRICLTDLWKASGSNQDKRPNDWLNYDNTKSFIDGVCSILNTVPNGIIISKRGKGGGSYAHRQVALAYAKYLSHELHILVNDTFFQRIEEEKNPELAVNRAVESWKRKGKNDKWISERIKGISNRNLFTGTLKIHGVKGKGYGDCTNAIYKPLYGGNAALVRQKKNLPEKSNPRESMSDVELAAVGLAELLAAQNIEKNHLHGNKDCEKECLRTSKLIAVAVSQSMQSTKNQHSKNFL